MKLKLITVFLGLTTLALGFTTCFCYLLNKASERTIKDRELTVTSYAKVIDAIGRSKAISPQQLKAPLLADFNLGEMGYNNHSDEYYIVAHPINREINPSQLGDFMGLQLVFDSQKTLKSIRLYKP